MANKDSAKTMQKSAIVASDANQALQNMGVLTPKIEDPESRVTYIVRESLQQKVKYIAVMEKKQIKDVVNKILDEFISEWERKNGKTPQM
jgi:hypothetical protein